jgi:hypothetical protein
MTKYIGISVIRISGEIFEVRVRDPYGNEPLLPVAEYISRGIKPDLEGLKDEQ